MRNGGVKHQTTGSAECLVGGEFVGPKGRRSTVSTVYGMSSQVPGSWPITPDSRSGIIFIAELDLSVEKAGKEARIGLACQQSRGIRLGTEVPLSHLSDESGWAFGIMRCNP